MRRTARHAQLLSDVRNDPITRKAVEDAQVVLFGIGGADLNAGDANFEARECRAEACYAPVLKSFTRNFDATVAAVRELRGSNNTVLRSITQPNVLTGAEDVIPPFLKPIATKIGVYQARTANRAICRVMAEYGGQCIDVLLAFNGPDGTANAYERDLLNHEDCCYPSAQGQQLMAELLFRIGLAPLCALLRIFDPPLAALEGWAIEGGRRIGKKRLVDFSAISRCSLT